MQDEEKNPNNQNFRVGMELDAMSLDELEKTIGVLKAEIGRLEREFTKKSATLSAAEGAFNL